ncbi:serine threonine- phosphatase BSL1 [Olea europaea subsp. europaea]|uniref:Serine threonine- phosphatase BSL1 n=1 Tax=Olea europaea subsp. europaea TaxID=158383 RepID=A0A8S0UFY9_OLEEU|nr:serine threonine- phosphatase BSL1 [Olea europaea subsp. europaea]
MKSLRDTERSVTVTKSRRVVTVTERRTALRMTSHSTPACLFSCQIIDIDCWFSVANADRQLFTVKGRRRSKQPAKDGDKNAFTGHPEKKSISAGGHRDLKLGLRNWLHLASYQWDTTKSLISIKKVAPSGKRVLSDAWALDTAQKPYMWQRLNPEGDRPSASM